MEELTLDVRGLTLCLCHWGPETGPAVVILHGFLDQGAAWAEVAEPLAQRGYRVVAPDQRGHGRSGHVGVGGYYHFPDYVTDLDAVVRWLGAEGRGPEAAATEAIVLVGHSMGGTVASLYAGLMPERVAALVVIEGLGPPSLDAKAAADQFRRHVTELACPPSHRPIASLEQAMERMRRYAPELSEAKARRLAERVTEPCDGGLAWRWDPLHRTRAAIAFDEERYLAILARVTAPVTLVVGSRSWFRFDISRRQAALVDLERVEIPSGHNPHHDMPHRLAQIIATAAGSPR